MGDICFFTRKMLRRSCKTVRISYNLVVSLLCRKNKDYFLVVQYLCSFPSPIDLALKKAILFFPSTLLLHVNFIIV